MFGSAVGGLIDGVPSFGSLISGPAKRSSSATYQPYKHPPQTLCFGGTGEYGEEGQGGKRIRKGLQEERRKRKKREGKEEEEEVRKVRKLEERRTE